MTINARKRVSRGQYFYLGPWLPCLYVLPGATHCVSNQPYHWEGKALLNHQCDQGQEGVLDGEGQGGQTLAM